MSYGVTRLLTSCLVWFIIATVVLFGYRDAEGRRTRLACAKQVARIGREFKIKVGQQLTFKGERLRLKFAAVEDDSRCPLDVTCVWAGNAEVLLEVSMSGRGSRSLKLNTNGSRQAAEEGKYQRYRVKLVELSPQPQSNRKIREGEYTATLLVSRE